MTPTLLIIDVQRASLERPDFFDGKGLVARLNALAARVRESAGRVIFVQQTAGPPGTPWHPDSPEWALVPGLKVEPVDGRVRKPTSDAFGSPQLGALLGPPAASPLLIAGCDTEYCIDATLRSALARGYPVTVPSDGHSLPDRPHLKAPQIIAHHNAIWSTVGAHAGPVRVCPCAELPG